MSLMTVFLPKLQQKLWREIDEFTSDDLVEKWVEYNYEDGEEGDTGIVQYYAGSYLVATKTILGGDVEEWTWTDFGWNYMLAKFTTMAFAEMRPKAK